MPCRRCGCLNPNCKCRDCKAKVSQSPNKKSSKSSGIKASQEINEASTKKKRGVHDETLDNPPEADSNQLDFFSWTEKNTNSDNTNGVDRTIKDPEICSTADQNQPEIKPDSVLVDNYYDLNGNHKWAKKSKIQNIGEDIDGSARHKRNAFRDWENVGLEIQKLVDDKDISHISVNDQIVNDLIQKTNEENALTNLAIKEILNKFPKKIKSHNVSPEQESAFNSLMKEKSQQLVKLSGECYNNPFSLIDTFRLSLQNEIRQRRSSGADWKLTNSLIDMHNSLINRGKASVPNKLAEFMTKSHDSKPWELLRILRDSPNPHEILDEIGRKNKDKAIAVMKGKSINSAFGVANSGSKKKKDRDLNESDFYKGFKFSQKKENYKTFDSARDYLVKSAGVRSIQFGNSLSDKEKEFHIKAAAQSFDDLSAITGLSASTLSCNGKLAIAFGARGKAGSVAHYSDKHKVLNLNRNSVGALAHELGHALDFNLKDKSSVQRDGPLSIKTRYGLSDNPSKVDIAFAQLHEQLDEYKKRMATTDSFRQLSLKKKGYYNSPAEVFARGFESYVEHKGKKNGVENTYLVAGVNHELYPNVEERESLEPYFDRLMQALKD